MAPFDRSYMSSYSRSIVTMALSGIVSEVKQDICRKSRFFHTRPAFGAHIKVERSDDGHIFWHQGRQMPMAQRGAKI